MKLYANLPNNEAGWYYIDSQDAKMLCYISYTYIPIFHYLMPDFC